jgi:hypothetical protein
MLVLTQRVSLTPLRKFWLAWKVQALGRCDAPPGRRGRRLGRPGRCGAAAAMRAPRSRCSRPPAPWAAGPARCPPPPRRRSAALDNGQHILIGAYRGDAGPDAALGVDPEALLACRCPALPRWQRPADPRLGRPLARPLDALAAIATARLALGERWRWCAPRSLAALGLCLCAPLTVADSARPARAGDGRADRAAVCLGPEPARRRRPAARCS